MSPAGYKTMVVLAVAAALSGCAGNGAGLDANGNPITPGSGSTAPLTADFQSIQDNVFTPICTKCHAGASAPEGLQLDESHSYALLVGVASAEQPNVERVDPGDPDSSYLIQKLEGAPTISGVQMPFGGPYLPQSTIDVIKQWITNGAPQSSSSTSGGTVSGPMSGAGLTGAAASASMKAEPRFGVSVTSPDDQSIVSTELPRIVVAFNSDVDSTLLNNSTVTLERIGVMQPMDAMTMSAMAAASTSPANAVTASNAVSGGLPNSLLPAAVTVPKGDPAAIVITPQSPLGSGTYRVTLTGAVADLNARALGSDYSFTFTVDVLQ
jgi:hypothetical protein